MIARKYISKVIYNQQTTLDAQHNISLDYKMSCKNNSKAISSMKSQAKAKIGHNQFYQPL
jgi:hypothetical protein